MTRINNGVNSIEGVLTTSQNISGYSLPISKYYTNTMTASAQNLTTSFLDFNLNLTLPTKGIYEIEANIVENLSGVTTSASGNSSTFRMYSNNNPYVVYTSVESCACITMSSDGIKIAHGNHTDVSPGAVYTSADGGATFIARTQFISGFWSAICSSSDGNFIAICDFQGYIYRSFDAGNTWLQGTIANTDSWTSIACSSDGSKLIACANTTQFGFVYTSINSGANWTKRTALGTHNWNQVCCNADGSIMYACNASDTVIHKTIDNGANWTSPNPFFSTTENWISMACDYTGLKVIVVFDSVICKSIDGGTNWTYPTVLLTHYNNMIMSKDGINTFFFRASITDYIYQSKDDGVTIYATLTPLGTATWGSNACSYDGSIISAAQYLNPIKTYTNIASILNSERLGTGVSTLTNTSTGNNSKNSNFNWVYQNNNSNQNISILGKINSSITGNWKVTSNTNGRSTITARLLS